MKKKVLLVVPSLRIGGQERIAVNTAIGLSQYMDVEMAIFHDGKENCYESPCNVINLNVPASTTAIGKILNQLTRSFRLFRIRSQKKYEVVISFGNTANLSNVLSGLLSKGKTVCALHGFAEVKKGFILSTVVKGSDKVICIAKAMQAELLKLYPECRNSIVVENGYILNELAPEMKSVQDNEAPIFVSMGRIERVKGFDILLRAFYDVHSVLPKARLWLIGDGSLRAEVEKEIEAKGLSDAIKMWGYQKNPHEILQKATMYVLSSRNEGLPNALIEALNARLPVIAVDCESGPREIITGEYQKKNSFGIEYGRYGVLVEQHPDEETRGEYLAKAMLDLVHQKAMQDEFKSRALGRAKDYSIDVYTQKLLKLLKSL